MTEYNMERAVIGWYREDGDFEVVAAVNCGSLSEGTHNESGPVLAAMLAVVKACHPNGMDIIAIERHELPDVLAMCGDEQDFQMNVVTIQV